MTPIVAYFKNELLFITLLRTVFGIVAFLAEVYRADENSLSEDPIEFFLAVKGDLIISFESISFLWS